MRPRSYLFVAGDDVHRLELARKTNAGAVIADLEDAIHPDRKETARAVLGTCLRDARSRDRGLQLVRINPISTSAGRADLGAIAAGRIPADGIVVPKARSAELHDLPASLHVVALIETAAGLRESFEIARAPAVRGLMIGAVDLALELKLTQDPDVDPLRFARDRLVLDSAAAGIAAPVDGVFVDVRDDEGLRAETQRARALGFRAKACVHPRQVEVVEAAFAPSADDVAWAERTDAAYRKALAAGRGVTAIDGLMVDAPVARRAQEILAEATGG
jgi:citrate lyase subunit beta / citryl-CoA lyase